MEAEEQGATIKREIWKLYLLNTLVSPNKVWIYWFNWIEGETVVIPVLQPYIKCDTNTQELIEIQKELFEFARKGELLVDYS